MTHPRHLLNFIASIFSQDVGTRWLYFSRRNPTGNHYSTSDLSGIDSSILAEVLD